MLACAITLCAPASIVCIAAPSALQPVGPTPRVTGARWTTGQASAGVYRGALSSLRASRARAAPPSALDAEPLAVRERVRQPLRQRRLYQPSQRAAPVIPGCHRLSLTSPAVILHSALPFCPAILQLTAIDCHPLVLGICILHTNLAVVAVHFSQNDGVAPGQPALLVYGGSQSRCGCARAAQSLSVAGRERSLEGILQGGAEGV